MNCFFGAIALERQHKHIFFAVVDAMAIKNGQAKACLLYTSSDTALSAKRPILPFAFSSNRTYGNKLHRIKRIFVLPKYSAEVIILIKNQYLWRNNEVLMKFSYGQ